MTTSLPLDDTYVAAIKHDLVDVPPDATLVGVVRRPTGWFNATVDENHTELGPPPALLDAFKRRQAAFETEGLSEERAHNAAWDAVDFDERYRSYLSESTEAQSVLSGLSNRLEDGERLVFVCFENTEKKRCHRTLLKRYVTEQL